MTLLVLKTLPLACVFLMFVYTYARFHIALIGRLTANLTGSHREIGGGIQIPVT